MGGHRAGEVASALSVSTIEAFVLHVLKRFSNLQATDEQAVLKDLQMAIGQAAVRITEEAAQHPEFAGMGTTLTMAFTSGWNLFVIHAGDSRYYLFRGGQLPGAGCWVLEAPVRQLRLRGRRLGHRRRHAPVQVRRQL